MTSSRSHLRDIRHLLGPTGEAIASDDAAVAAWAPDPNYKPQRYHLLRAADESAFRALAAQAGLAVEPTTEAKEAFWRLPSGLTLAGWAADSVPAGAGLQARGGVGEATVGLRWHQGQLFVVVMRS